MDFNLSKEETALREKARTFVEKECLALEETYPLSDYEAPDHVVKELRKK